MRVISRTKLRILGVMFGLLAILVVAIFVDSSKRDITSAIDPLCPSGVNIAISGGTTASTLSGAVNVIVGSTTTSSLQINRVVIYANNQAIGQAQPNGTYSWSMPWLTTLFPNGQVTLSATISASNNTTNCTTPTLSAFVQNTTTNSLESVINPTMWQGPISYSFPVSANVAINGTAFNPTPYALFQWTASIGNISPVQNNAQFSSGQTVGTGAINLVIRYSGATITRNIPISVRAPDSPLPDPGTTSASNSSTTSTPTSKNTTATPPKTAALQNNPVAQNCIVSAIGQDRYDQINNSKDRPKPEELAKINICFAPNNYILPSNFAPVAPLYIKDLKFSDQSKITKLENAEKQNDNGKQKVLKITGQATAKSTVVLYVFSDPLVLTTTADDSGNWTYTLEDPIEPGSHEIYSVVNRSDGSYERSNPFSFIIGTATAAEANPNGLSLQLAETATPAQSQRGMTTYIIGSVVLLLTVLVAFFVVIKLRTKKPATVLSPVTTTAVTPSEIMVTPSSEPTPEPVPVQSAESKPSSEVQPTESTVESTEPSENSDPTPQEVNEPTEQPTQPDEDQNQDNQTI